MTVETELRQARDLFDASRFWSAPRRKGGVGWGAGQAGSVHTPVTANRRTVSAYGARSIPRSATQPSS
jgi:hypothetical protein